MRLDRRTLIGSALFVAGYVSFTLLDEVLLKKKALTAEVLQPMVMFAAAVGMALCVWYLVQKYRDGQ